MPQVTSTNLKMVGKLSSGLTTMKYDIAISFYIAPQAHRLCRHARSPSLTFTNKFEKLPYHGQDRQVLSIS